jgi:hypothetical protein
LELTDKTPAFGLAYCARLADAVVAIVLFAVLSDDAKRPELQDPRTLSKPPASRPHQRQRLC